MVSKIISSISIWLMLLLASSEAFVSHRYNLQTRCDPIHPKLPLGTKRAPASTVVLTTAAGGDADQDANLKKSKRKQLISYLQQPNDNTVASKRHSKWSIHSKRPDIESGQRYGSKDWLNNLLSIPSSFVLRRIQFHLMSNTILSLLVVLVDRFWFRLSVPYMAHTLVGSFLGLLLVLRTDSAYSRFWEARHIWAKTKETCRNLAITASTQLKYHSPNSATRLVELLIAFPDALAYTCLCGAVPLSSRLKRNVPDHMQGDPAMALCLLMQQELLAAAQESPSSGLNIIEARYHMEASNFIQTLMSTTTHCEMIVRTPVPWSYSRHTSRFLTIWCGTLPFVLVPIFGWLTLPAVMVVCWCLFGIEEIGHLIEQPFVSDDVVSQRYMSKADRIQLKAKGYDLGIPVEQLAWVISSQVVQLSQTGSQLSAKVRKATAMEGVKGS